MRCTMSDLHYFMRLIALATVAAAAAAWFVCVNLPSTEMKPSISRRRSWRAFAFTMALGVAIQIIVFGGLWYFCP